MSHDAPETIVICWFGAQETYIIIIIINVENHCSAKYICENNVFCSGFFDEQKDQNNSIYKKCNKL